MRVSFDLTVGLLNSDLFIMDFEWFKGLWRSWPLLIGGTLALSGLWLLPPSWLSDAEVAKVHAEWRGYIGFGAWCFAAVTASRLIVEASALVGRWIQGLPERQRQKAQKKQFQDKILRRLRHLEASERQLLESCVISNSPEITVLASDPRTQQLYEFGILSFVGDIGDPEHKFRIHDWAWVRLREDPNLLKPYEERDDTE